MAQGRETAVDSAREPRSSRQSDSATRLYWPIPEKMMRSAIYRRLPATTRMKLDTAVLLRADHGETLEAIAARFKLKENYRIGPAALRTYARLLEDTIRPVMTSLLMSSLLGCLDPAQRAEVTEGSRILLLSRVVQWMNERNNTPSAADMARLGALFKPPASASGGRRWRNSTRHGARKTGDPEMTSFVSGDGLEHLEEAIGMLYGLDPRRTPDPQAEGQRAPIGGADGREEG